VPGILTQARFVRHQDASIWDLRDLLAVNPRSGSVETRAGLSWTGVKRYQTQRGPLRVLRRREQVESPGHVRTLRRLPLPDQHPSGDRDVTPANSDELVKGWSGDKIDIEVVGGFARPVADLTIFKPDTFCKMMSLEQWTAYQRDYSDFAQGITRPSGPARTGTSLGYNALWLGPTNESEIIAERDGALVGEWLGPDGVKYEYDAEHVLDPDCEIVQRLVRENGFDPLTLGGQHFAIALDSLAGRGAEQSELLRVVDSQLIGADPTLGRVQFQVPRATRNIDMPSVEEASPDLSTVDNGDAPSRDSDEAADTGDIMTTPPKQIVAFGIRDRGITDLLTRKSIVLPQVTNVTLDEGEAMKVQPLLDELMGIVAKLAEALKMSETDASEAGAKVEVLEEKMADMPSVEEAQAKVAEMQTKLDEAVAAVEAAKTAATEQKTADTAAITKLTADIAKLDDELVPVRAQQLADMRTKAASFGLAQATADACVDAPALRRAFVVHAVKTNDGTDYATVDQSIVDSTFNGAWAMATPKQAAATAKKPEYVPGAGLQAVPNANSQTRDADDAKNKPAPGAVTLANLG
jgi:hypothetical protein